MHELGWSLVQWFIAIYFTRLRKNVEELYKLYRFELSFFYRSGIKPKIQTYLYKAIQICFIPDSRKTFFIPQNICESEFTYVYVHTYKNFFL